MWNKLDEDLIFELFERQLLLYCLLPTNLCVMCTVSKQYLGDVGELGVL